MTHYRQMPSVLSDGVTVPTIPIEEWYNQIALFVRVVAGRELTQEEKRRRGDMANANWNVRIVAEAIIGRDITEVEMEKINEIRGIVYPYPNSGEMKK